MPELMSLLFCLFVASGVWRRLRLAGGLRGALADAQRSLRTGALLVTVPLLAYFDVAGLALGRGPSPFWLAVLGALGTILLLGFRVRLTGHPILDLVLPVLALLAALVTVVCGLPAFFKWVWNGHFRAWFLACLGAALLVGLWSWASERRNRRRDWSE